MADPSITVTGTGVMSAVPDAVLLSLGATIRQPTVLDAFDGCTRAMTAIADALRAAGVAADDMQTANVSLHENYERPGEYEASQSLHVKLSSVEQARQVIPDAIAAGGDAARLHGLSFAISDPRPLVSQARELAMRDARARAGHLAELAGGVLGEVARIQEQSHGDSRLMGLPPGKTLAARHSMAMESGSEEIRVSVEVEFALTP